VSENIVLRKISGTNRTSNRRIEKNTQSGASLLVLLSKYYGAQINVNEMDGSCSMYRGDTRTRDSGGEK
jgi:hypothetical protein